ncbi:MULTISPECIES: hypothetical protein [unclassified Mycobacterium]|uniref:hypothetical protein n=1 Tax=unclassified Mycobacterium TaxID=2642494 RepID=UPI0029C75308|nr:MULTISPECIES: hypothetical protein [unclassified Mycobacterium]
MRERVQGCVTVGVAMVGAGALALAPMAPQPAQQMRADQIRTVDVSDMKLLAATATPTPASLLAALQILGTGVGGSGERLVESTLKGLLGPIALAGAFGDDAATKAIIADYIDGPLYVADPTIFALDKVLPEPLGQDPNPDPRLGNTSDVLKFRVNVLYALREAIKDALGVQPAVGIGAAAAPVGETLPTTLPEKLAELAKGLAGSGENFVVDTALGALTPLAVIQALGSDNPEAALTAIAVNFIDAPLHIADPTIFALDNVLPEPFGGDTSLTPQFSQGSDILKFRVQVLYALREQIKQSLGLPSALDTSLLGRSATTLAEPDPVGDPVFTATRLAQGLAESGQRFVTDTALGALGPIAAAQALVKGDKQGLYDVAESYVDAPLHIADPTIFAIDDVLPKPIGGDPSTTPTDMHGSLVSDFRANVLIPARDSIKPGLKNVLGVPKPDTDAKVVETPVSKSGADSSTTTEKAKTGPKHRATVNNPVSSALKKLAKDVKKATTPPKHEKASAE